MHLVAGAVLGAAGFAVSALQLATDWPSRVTWAWLAVLPLAQLVYVGPVFGLAWRANRPLAQGVGVGAAVTVAAYLAAALASLV
ncbi:MAG: hypothetical protein R3F59_37490 [Myxococcota bacterium]